MSDDVRTSGNILLTDGGIDREEMDSMSLKLRELQESPEKDEYDEMLEKKRCGCGEEHLGEIYSSPPSGYKIRWWCPKKERRFSRSYP